MRRRPDRFNRKRRIDKDVAPELLVGWAQQVRYGGNPEHKRNPGDFGLTPPASPRPDKELCDEVEIFHRTEALALLHEGLRRGLVSAQRVGRLPQNIWSVTADGVPLEAQLENRDTAFYHGYPLSERDPFSAVVLDAWRQPDE